MFVAATRTLLALALVAAALTPAKAQTAAIAPASRPEAKKTAPEPAPVTRPEDAPDWELGEPPRLDFVLNLGLGHRVDDPPLYVATQRTGFRIGGDVDVFFARRVSFGVGYEHLDLGREESGVTPTGSVAIDRELHNLWANARLYPWMGDSLGVYLRLRLGIGWQAASLAGNVWSEVNPASSAVLECHASDSANLSIGAEAGLDVTVTRGFHFLFAPSFDGHRLGDGLIDNCAPGAGTALVLGLRTGFVYSLDLK
jgi:hypothetical protein